MAAETNLQATADYAKALNIDFANRFGNSIATLLRLIGIQRAIPMNSGSVIKTYTSSVTLENGTVAPGDIIPLSKVVTTPGPTHELVWQKYRKGVPVETIQAVGFDQAVEDTDNKLLREIQKDIRGDFFAQLAAGTTLLTSPTLQDAFARAWQTVQVKFEDDGARTVAFAHPNDVADHLATANLTIQKEFGLTFVQGFTGVDVVIVTPGVPEGTIYATAVENLAMAYANMDGGEIDKVFDFYVEETGLLGVTHDVNKQRLTAETIVAGAFILFAERLDGIAKITIQAPAG